MTDRNGLIACLLVGLTCSCATSNGADAARDEARSGADSGGAGGSSASAGTGGGGASGSGVGGGGGTRGGVGGASSGGSSGGTGGDASGATSGSATGGSSTGGDAGDSAGTSDCAAWTSDEWRALPSGNAPSAREEPWVIPTDDGMLVFGGYNHQLSSADPFLDDGAIYHLCDDSWAPMSTSGVPHAITDTVAQRPMGFWTGSDLLVWGGFQSPSGGYEEGEAVAFATRYSVTRNAWSDMKRDGEPSARDYLVRSWTGDRLLVWGGIAQSGDKSWVNHDDGALYDPKLDSWTAMSTQGAPAGRYATDRAVWTGEKLIVWGGMSFDTGMNYNPAVTSLDDGGVYDLASDTWTPIATAGAPHGGLSPFAWTGKELVVVSQLDGYGTPGEILFEGARFDPTANVWAPMSAPSLELADTLEAANLKLYWVGDLLAVFGTKIGQTTTAALLLYDPQSDTWSSGTVPSTPPFSSWQSATVVGKKLVVIGTGEGSADARGAHHESTAVNVLDATTLTWTSLPAALNRSHPSSVALSNHLLFWGGKDIYTNLDAPNPCAGATGPCNPITPTIQTLLAGGAGISH